MITDSHFWLVLEWWAREKRCRMCSKRFEQPWLIATGEPWPGNLLINGEFAFHWQDSHGIDQETLVAMMNEQLYQEAA